MLSRDKILAYRSVCGIVITYNWPFEYREYSKDDNAYDPVRMIRS